MCSSSNRITLQRDGYYDNTRRIVTLAGQNNVLCLPITIDAFTVLSNDKDNEDTKDFVFASLRHQSVNNKHDIVSPRAHLIAELETLVCKKLGVELLKDVPSSWQKVGDAVILPKDSFQNPLWSTFGDELWVAVAKTLNASRIAVGNEILPDPFRTPNLKLVLGESGWVQHRENGIVYCLDITKSMFASGNTTERVRIGNLTCTGETVLDLYSGVGYFVLPYLVHANASTVHACEWNPHAVEGLRRGLQANGGDLSAKCIIHFGDNRKVKYEWSVILLCYLCEYGSVGACLMMVSVVVGVVVWWLDGGRSGGWCSGWME